MKNLYECIVIGGGIAGSTAAYHLAQLGYNVALIEKSQGAHHKVCGEFLSFEAISYLMEMGIRIGDDSPIVKRFRIFSPSSDAGFTFPSPGRGVTRYKLDEELLNNAKSAGVHVFRGVCMKNYNKDEDGLFQVETNGEDFRAHHLFMAIGKHDSSKEHKRIGKDNAYIGLKSHLRLRHLSDDYKETTVLFTFPGGYGGVCPVENGIMNFCFVIKKDIYKSLNGNFKDVLAYVCRSNSKLDLVMQDADFIGPVYALGHIPYGFLCPQVNQEDVFFAGDQRMVIPSFTGDGMCIAISTARDCAYEFHRRQKGSKTSCDLKQHKLQKQMHWALLGHTILKFSWLIDACAIIPGLKTCMIKAIFNNTRISFENNNFRC